MKSLEEVIKYKLNFLPKEIEPFYGIQTHTTERRLNFRPGYRPPCYEIYKTKNTIFSNSFSFMEDITPLLIYILSCENYHRENGNGKFDNIFLGLKDNNERDIVYPPMYDIKVNRISSIKRCEYRYLPSVSYYHHNTKPYTIIFSGWFDLFLTYEQRLAEARREDEIRRAEAEEEEDEIRRAEAEEEEEEEEDFPINDSKTFKLEQCVICLEKEPKVLFCNCGHICICNECLVKKLDNCPVCKTENTILRIIE